MHRLLFALCLALLFAGQAKAADDLPYDEKIIAETVAKAAQLPRIHALIVAEEGKPIVEKVFRGPGLDRPVNIKSASKVIIDALVGIAIDRGMIKAVDQPMLPC